VAPPKRPASPNDRPDEGDDFDDDGSEGYELRRSRPASSGPDEKPRGSARLDSNRREASPESDPESIELVRELIREEIAREPTVESRKVSAARRAQERVSAGAKELWSRVKQKVASRGTSRAEGDARSQDSRPAARPKSRRATEPGSAGSSERPRRPEPIPQAGLVRTLCDFVVALAIAVSLFRAFIAEGYWIETGSMATSLLGHHLRATCYACGHVFPTEISGSIEWARCPNCQAGSIKTEGLPVCDGDQLLVFRPLFDHRQPERFSVVVFRNPADPKQAFVKRVVGFPGETVRIERGDLFINGELQRKSLARQRSMRVLVHTQQDQPAPDDATWKPRWVTDRAETGWSRAEGVWRYRLPGTGSPAGQAATTSPSTPSSTSTQKTTEPDWLGYRHWLRSGGHHATMVAVRGWPSGVERPHEGFGPLSFDEQSQRLVVRGVLPPDLQAQLSNANLPVEFRDTVHRLAEASHIAPIMDDSAYNRRIDGGGRYEVRDLMVAARVTLVDESSRLVISLTDGREQLDCTFEASKRLVRLTRPGVPEPIAEGLWPASLTLGKPALLEISLMDGQWLAAIDGELALPVWTYTPKSAGTTAWRPVRIGASGGGVDLADLTLYRDVYYTGGKSARATQTPLVLGPTEYFMLGDNSPVSRDSRSWTADQPVTAALLLGKPFVVHLPTRRQAISLGKWTLNIRVPEFSRMRYIR
jgi:signal peptidase I